MTATALPSRFGIPPSFLNYRFDKAYDEMFEAGVPREHYRALHKTLLGLPPEELRKSQTTRMCHPPAEYTRVKPRAN